MKIKISGII
uniref:Uncharacterized protein n=1 Tax=Anguilla anguilla TaxID=7936 RepID=A0A0E9XWW9_ANGAN